MQFMIDYLFSALIVSVLDCLEGVDCLVLMNSVCVFFCKQKTAYEMRISDWSSDVCSSDLRFADLRRFAISTDRVGGFQEFRVRRLVLDHRHQHRSADSAR